MQPPTYFLTQEHSSYSAIDTIQRYLRNGSYTGDPHTFTFENAHHDGLRLVYI